MKIKGNLSLFAKPHDSVNISPSAEFREVVVRKCLGSHCTIIVKILSNS